MAKLKACKKCKLLTTEDHCKYHKNAQLTPSWQGRINIINAKESEIAKRMGVEHDGEYAIKIR